MRQKETVAWRGGWLRVRPWLRHIVGGCPEVPGGSSASLRADAGDLYTGRAAHSRPEGYERELDSAQSPDHTTHCTQVGQHTHILKVTSASLILPKALITEHIVHRSDNTLTS